MHIPRVLLSLTVALVLPLAHAQSADPLKSAACGAALQQLEGARSAAGSAAQVEALRQKAAGTCLGNAHPPARPGRLAQAPVTVPPPIIEPPPRPPLLAPPASIPPPVQVERPATVTACDPGGCWIDNGGRLQHVAPNLLGPNGLCTSAAGTLHCP